MAFFEIPFNRKEGILDLNFDNIHILRMPGIEVGVSTMGVLSRREEGQIFDVRKCQNCEQCASEVSRMIEA